MDQTKLTPIPIYELLFIYKALGEPFSMKFCYQSVSDHQAVRDAIDHVNELSRQMELTVLSLEVFCVELRFRGADPDQPDLIVNQLDRQIYDSQDLDLSLIGELPSHMDARVV